MNKRNQQLSILIVGLSLIIGITIPSLAIEKSTLTGYNVAPFLIDDANPSKDWNHYATTYAWCSGSGTWSDPYIIENLTINAWGFNQAITIQNSNVPFIIKDCTIYGALAGIRLDIASNGIITNCNLTQNSIAIFLLFASINNTIANNYIAMNDYGIRIDTICDNNIVRNNDIIDNNRKGIAVRGYSDYNEIFLNNVSLHDVSGVEMGVGIDIEDAEFTKVYSNFLSDNIVGIETDNTISTNISKNTIIESDYGIINNYATNTTINLNNLNNLDVEGIYLGHTFKNNVSANTIYRGETALYIYESDNSSILNNLISYQLDYGIKLTSNSANNTISKNIVQDSVRGIGLIFNDINNTIFYNCLKNSTYFNTLESMSLGNNSWDNGTHGNYYDDYGGVDIGGDGIGDTPYNISGTMNNKDFFPLMECDLIPPEIIEIPTDIGSDLEGKVEPPLDLSWIWILILGIGISSVIVILIYFVSKRY